MADLEPAAPKLEKLISDSKETNPAACFLVKFWGVKNQIATPGKDNLRYGGNTSCVEMRVADKRLIFDGGTGIRKLGNSLLSQMPVEAHIFFTHCHWDRIQGFPFFVPAFIPGNCFHIYGADASNGSSFQERLAKQMTHPNFPVPIQVMQSELKFHCLTPGQKENLDNVEVETILLNNTHRSVAYRVSWQKHSVVYATDLEYSCESFPQNLLNLAQNADLLILDVPEVANSNLHNSASPELQEKVWLWSVETAKAARVKQVVLSSHSPDYNDDRLDQMEQKIKSVFGNACLAREGMLVSVN
ncbi:MAG: MBL fold metallo-hydrolase [Oscillatoria sp. PMC 1051.18]|nr:MBL fold metallo-hydrolase [Oscillatoria sp. PMC 1050.18]MEC5032732.1 MBL fold metallo-hydrolase [Oscillatoria sp. PMC 1051.18]